MYIHLTYRIETTGSIEQMAAKIASDQSTGTFVAVPGETEELKVRRGACAGNPSAGRRNVPHMARA